ncbi:MAG: histidinol-phosphatase HisJ family protein [Clostridiales bacterium]|nr:histidinol-phosphatase HisJ family protein [Clostridiales bacterium]
MKIYTDQHVHTEFSLDSRGNMLEYILRAKNKGQTDIMFTDHVDIGNPDELFIEPIDYDTYIEYARKLSEKYDIDIKIGVEIGYDSAYHNEIVAFVNKYPFDFVIGSIHMGDGLDFYTGDFFKGKTQREAYYRYFELVEEMIDKFSDFDVVGHLDYITRYGNFVKKAYNYEEYKEIIDRILGKIITKGKGIELNMSGLRNDLNVTHPKREVLEQYFHLGGSIITIGSDAHFIKDYGAGIKEGIALMKEIGVKEINYFHKRKIIKNNIFEF